MTPEMFGGEDFNGVRIQILGEDDEVFAALGHLDPAVMAAATQLAMQHVGADLDGIDAQWVLNAVEHRWAVLEPMNMELRAPDEWSIRWVAAAAPDAFAVTVIEPSALEGPS